MSFNAQSWMNKYQMAIDESMKNNEHIGGGLHVELSHHVKRRRTVNVWINMKKLHSSAQIKLLLSFFWLSFHIYATLLKYGEDFKVCMYFETSCEIFSSTLKKQNWFEPTFLKLDTYLRTREEENKLRLKWKIPVLLMLKTFV